MVDVDTFLTALFVMVDDFCHSRPPKERRAGPDGSLSLNTFGLHRERPHELSGVRARLAARVALHNFCVWLNDQLGRPWLAFVDLLGW